MNDITLDFSNNEFCTALDLIQDTNESFFLTGKAGTGKSTFLKYIVEKKAKNYVVVAPTGIAAINVGGVTIHSFFQFPHSRPFLPDDNEIKVFFKNSERRKIIERMDTLIIDEISMVRVDLLDAIDCSLRRNGGNPNLPFGGKQVVFVGDVFQLEPIVKKGTIDEEIISEIWGGSYFYRAKVFEKIKLLTIELQKVYRQSDPEFITLLNKVRENRMGQKDIDIINSKVTVEADLKKKKFVITLTTTNEIAYIENSKRLSELNSDPKLYNAEVSGEFHDSKFPTEPEIILKVGAQIIFIKNDFEKRWVNGTIAEVSELTEKSISVKLQDGRIYPVEKQVWENYKYFYNRVEKKIDQEVIGTFKQYPLKLAWAITIHKSQGLTLDNVIIDIGNGIFASGQAYVALSRVTSFNGLFLKKKIHLTDIFVDDEIKDFAKSFNDVELLQKSLSFGRKIYQLQKNNNTEGIGKMYFDNAIASLVCGNFKAAYSEMVQGFKNITCDCHIVSLIEKYREDIIISFKNNQINCTTDEWDFTRAVFYFFINDFKKAKTLINSYLDENANSEIGHYINARIESTLGNKDEAVIEYEVALSLNKTSRVHYRLGRLKEESMSQFGIHNLLQSILLNPSSLCSYYHYFMNNQKRRVKLKDSFQKLVDRHRFDEVTNNINIILQDDIVELFGDAITYTLKGLKNFEKLQISPMPIELNPCKIDEKWGYCDKNNSVIIDCIYDEVLPFEGCIAAVKLNEEWRLINCYSKLLIDKGKYKIHFSEIKNGIFKEGRAGLCKLETNLYGFIDITGSEVVPFIYDGLQPFSDGLALVYKCYGKDNSNRDIYLYGFVDKSGREVIPLKYLSAKSFSEELAAVRDKNGNCGFIDKEGKIAIPLIYEDVQPFSKGLAGVRGKNGKWGFIRKTGNVELPFIYDCINPFSGLDLGLYTAALVKLNEEWQYIDEKGKLIINLNVYILRNYVIKQQERLGKQVHGVFVVPVFDREKNTEEGILPPKLNTDKVIYKTISQNESQLLVMSVDPLNYKEDSFWEVPDKLDVKAAFINVQTSLIEANYKAGINIGGYIKTKFSSGFGDLRNVLFGIGTNIPCVCKFEVSGEPHYSPIYCENLWIDRLEKIDISEPSVKKSTRLKPETKYDRRNRIKGFNKLGGIQNIEPFIANLSEIQSVDSFGCIDKIHGLSENDYYYQNEIVEGVEYENRWLKDEFKDAFNNSTWKLHI